MSPYHWIVVLLLLYIAWRVNQIAKRTRESIPTDAEQDYDFAMKDPMGHWQAHKDEN